MSMLIISIISILVSIAIPIITMCKQNKSDLYDKRELFYRACRIIVYGCRYGGDGEQVKDDLKRQGLEFICDDSNGAKFLFDEETASFIADVFYNWKKYNGAVNSFNAYGDNNATKELCCDYMEEYKEAAEFFKFAKEQLPKKFETYLKMIQGCAPMSKIFNHLNNNKTKYIIGILLIAVISMSLYIFGNQDNKIEKLSKSVLMLNIYDTKEELFATGSGFVAFENDVLVTNYHVIDKAYKIEAVDENDVVYSLDKVVAFDEEKDLAILKFSNPTDLKALEVYNSSNISKGDEVIAIGSPLGLKNTVSKGIVSSIREDKETSIIQITAPISSGSSGGALLNENGKVIGVTFAGIEDGQNLNLAIPSNYITDLFKLKTDGVDIKSFYYEQNPIEKYKMECEYVELSNIFDCPGKYHHKDICVSGWVSSFDGRAGYIVENTAMISYDSDYDFSLCGKKENRILRFKNDNYETDIINENIHVGDYITIYGNLFDQRIYSSKWNFDHYGREIGNPKAIDIN